MKLNITITVWNSILMRILFSIEWKSMSWRYDFTTACTDKFSLYYLLDGLNIPCEHRSTRACRWGSGFDVYMEKQSSDEPIKLCMMRGKLSYGKSLESVWMPNIQTLWFELKMFFIFYFIFMLNLRL